jgi:ATP-dependent Lon protease
VAVKFANNEIKKAEITADNLEEYLGAARYDHDNAAMGEDEVGAATGLAWTAVGGTTLTIEVSAMRGKGDIVLTGKLGDVMKESARAAISYIRSNSATYGINDDAFANTDIHVHVPEGATPKDGPSAGITMATAILSAFTQKPVKKSVAMTGEITLRGKVLPIGGLKEKALAAYRIGVTDIIIPQDNTKDLEEIPENVREKLHFIPVSNVDSVFKTAIIGL